MQDSLVPDLRDQSPGSHSYELVAHDAAGNTSTSITGTFVLDPNPPNLDVTGPLADSDGQPLPSDTADATIEATDSGAGDTGITRIDVAVDDSTVASDPLNCDPSCPSQAQTTYTFNKSDWEQGSHTVTVSAVDTAGNVANATLDVEESQVKPPVDCPSDSPTSQQPVDVITPTEASDAAMSPVVAPSEPTSDPQTGDSIDPSLSQPGDSPPIPLASDGTLTNDDVSSTPAGGVNVDETICLVPKQTTDAATNADVINGDSAIYANSAPQTDTVVRPAAAGETVIESMRGDSSPDSFSWKVAIPEGDQLTELDDGGVAAVDPTLAPPADLTVPDQPSDAQDPAAIPDAASQLAVADHEVAYAEQQTGSYVDAVIAPPYVADAGGGTHAAPLTVTGSDTVTLSTPGSTVGSHAAVINIDSNLEKGNLSHIVRSYPMIASSGHVKDEAYGAACDYAKHEAKGKRLLILDFAGPIA